MLAHTRAIQSVATPLAKNNCAVRGIVKRQPSQIAASPVLSALFTQPGRFFEPQLRPRALTSVLRAWERSASFFGSRSDEYPMKYLLMSAGFLTALACLIAFFGLTEDYDRAISAEAGQARVLGIDGETVEYERFDPESPWDEDGDGWVGPYFSEDIPAKARATLSEGSPLVIREGEPELALAPPSKLLLAGVGAGLFLAIWALVAPIIEQRKLAAAGGDPSRVFTLMVKKTRNASFLAGGSLIGLGTLVAVVPFLTEEPKLWELVFLVGLGVVSIIPGLLMVKSALPLLDPRKAPIIRAMEQTPERIVWVYVHIVEVNGFPSHNVWLCFDDGERFEFNLRQLEPTVLIASLEERLPHAVFGYHADLEALYSQSPADFLAWARR